MVTKMIGLRGIVRVNVQKMHTSATRAYPRGSVKASELSIESQEDSPAQRWTKYVRTRKVDENSPLESHIEMSYGTVRLDSQNRPLMHGHLDHAEALAEDDVIAKSRTGQQHAESVMEISTQHVIRQREDDEEGGGLYLEHEPRSQDKVKFISISKQKKVDKQTTSSTHHIEPKPENNNKQLKDKGVENVKLTVEKREPQMSLCDEPQVKQVTKHKKKQDVKEKEEDGDSKKEPTALEYVKLLRQQSIVEPHKELKEVRPSKESDVEKLDHSLQKRLFDAVGTIARSGDEDGNETSKIVKGEGERSEVNPDGRVQQKFLPNDLSKLTSVEVQALLNDSVVFDRFDVVALFKPYGLPMFGDALQHTVEKYLPDLAKHVGTDVLHQVHRLDKCTTGLLLLAKTKDMHLTLVDLFRRRLIEKRYWAILNGTPTPSEGIIDIPLTETQLDGRYRITVRPDYSSHSGIVSNKTRRIRNKSKLMPAVTEFTVLTQHNNASLVEVKPATGFKNQIRAHMGFGLNCPILGDHKFSHIKSVGMPQTVHGDILKRLGIRRTKARDLPMYLHAKKLLIPEIVQGRDVWIDAKLPHFFNKAMKTLLLKPKTALK